ncbi:MAG: glutamate racemase [Cyanobacteria bacterium PR.3.49]|jgi:glutamate racemase|nr:glutamate racemase [Cyanobacteria bacterium PR.3.49]
MLGRNLPPGSFKGIQGLDLSVNKSNQQDMSGDAITKGARIGLFDSGLGGLSVLRQLSTRLGDSAHSFVYVGDTARCPYGDRSAGEISHFVAQIVDWISNQTVDSIVIACNTSAAVAGDEVRKNVNVPVIDLIAVTADYVARNFQRIGVIATSTTVKRKAFSKAIHERDSHKHVTEIACPDLVPLIERGMGDTKEMDAALKKYCDKLLKEEAQAVILGCTHFPFVEAALKRLLQDRIQLIDPAVLLADSIAQSIASTSGTYTTASTPTRIARSHIYTTGDPSRFRQTAKICLGYPLDTVNGITVDELTMTQPAISLVEHAVNSGTVTPNMVPATT